MTRRFVRNEGSSAASLATGRAMLHAASTIGCMGLALIMPFDAYATAMPANGNGAGVSTANADSATSAASGVATSGVNTGSAPAAATPPSSPTPTPTTPAPVTARTPAATSAPPAAVAKAPTAVSAPAAATPNTPASASYSPKPQLRFGGYLVFRNLIPSPMLEAQAAEEFNQIAYGAEHANRLYADTDAHVTRVHSIVDKLIPYSLKWNERAKNWKWDVAVVRSPDIRMYCLPGGKIVVYGGLLDRAHLNDNELGVLIGHEIAHALREHARERLGELQSSQLDSSGTIPQLFGLADLGVAPLGIGSRLLEMKYENTDETEADVIGSDIASRAGFDPRAAVTLWDKLAVATRSDRDRGFIYVHPYTPARRQDIIKRLPDMLPLYAKAIGTTVDALPDYAGMGRPRRRTVQVQQ